MRTLKKTTEIIQAGTLMPNFRPSLGSNLPVLHTRNLAVAPPVSLARLPEVAKKLSAGITENTIKKTVKRVSQPRTYKRPSNGFD